MAVDETGHDERVSPVVRDPHPRGQLRTHRRRRPDLGDTAVRHGDDRIRFVVQCLADAALERVAGVGQHRPAYRPGERRQDAAHRRRTMTT